MTRETNQKRPAGLIVIVIYKCLVVGLLIATTLALWLTLRNHQVLQSFVEAHFIEGAKANLIDLLLSKLLNLSPRALKFSGIATATYALVTAIEAAGLWYQKAWAELLVIGLLGLSLPPEVFELIQGASLLKWLIFGINLATLAYVVRQFYSCRATQSRL